MIPSTHFLSELFLKIFSNFQRASKTKSQRRRHFVRLSALSVLALCEEKIGTLDDKKQKYARSDLSICKNSQQTLLQKSFTNRKKFATT